MKQTKIISHANCNDGFGALFAAWKHFGDAPNVQYMSYQYNDPIPEIDDGDDVYIFDISFEEGILMDWHKRANVLMLRDHHKSAQEKLGHLSFCHFDMEHSGACLAWNYFFPATVLPTILSYVEDRDLWRFKLPHSKAINAFIESRPRNFSTWDIESGWLDDGKGGFELAMKGGYALLDYQSILIDGICKKAYEDIIGGHKIMIANTPILHSEVGHKLLELHPDIGFSATFYRDGQKEYYSLRSENSRVDVSKIASVYGGGGHRNAAGFVRNITTNM